MGCPKPRIWTPAIGTVTAVMLVLWRQCVLRWLHVTNHPLRCCRFYLIDNSRLVSCFIDKISIILSLHYQTADTRLRTKRLLRARHPGREIDIAALTNGSAAILASAPSPKVGLRLGVAAPYPHGGARTSVSPELSRYLLAKSVSSTTAISAKIPAIVELEQDRGKYPKQAMRYFLGYLCITALF